MKPARLQKFVWAICLCLVVLPLEGWSAVSARLNQSKVYVGDSVTLEIVVEGSNKAQPNLDPLTQNFEILGTGSGTQVQMFNGQTRERRTWSVRMRPKKQGVIPVPFIAIGAETTQPLSLEVIEIPTSSSTGAEDLFLESEVVESSVYVQQQIQLITRVYHRRPLLSGEWTDPTIENAVVERLGDGRQFQTRRNGHIYQVIERRYAVFPEKSGTLLISPTHFSGEIEQPLTSQQRPRFAPGGSIEDFFRNDPFADDFFFSNSPFRRVPGKPVRVVGKALTVEVKPLPENFTAPHWLPASGVELTDSWQTNPPDFSAGQPVTRNISVEAKGLAASQLPSLGFADIPHASVYAEPPVTSTRTDGQWVYARSSQTVTYVPHQNGRLVIPKVSLEWWNTVTDKPETSGLEPWTVTVSGLSAKAPIAEPAEEKSKMEVGGKEDPSGKNDPDSQQASFVVETYWVGLLFLGVSGIYGWLWIKRKESLLSESRSAVFEKQKLLKALKMQCENRDALGVYRTLVSLGRTIWPDEAVNNLRLWGEKIPLAQLELENLDQCLFGHAKGKWNGGVLFNILRESLVVGSASGKKEMCIKGLYP